MSHEDDENIFQDSTSTLMPSMYEEERTLARMACYAADRYVAFAPHTTQEVLERPAITPVPGCAYYAYGLLRWQEQWLPLISLEAMVQGYPAFDASHAPRYALVLAWQAAPQEPLQYGAIALEEIPVSIMVGDRSACDLPQDSDLWPELALSCFELREHAVPILDTARLFAQYHG